MLSVQEALLVLRAAVPAPRERVFVPLSLGLGHALAQDVRAEMDQPPFEKSSMDGWAVRSTDVYPEVRLRIVGRVLAGTAPGLAIGAGETAKIMTGAPLPEGADAVVMVERSTEDGAGHVTLHAGVAAGENVCHRGEDLREGEVVLRKGTHLEATALALLASVGCDPVPVHALPRVMVLPTGDELVSAHGPRPLPGQIRESNGVYLEAALRTVLPGVRVVRTGIAPDAEAQLLEHLRVGLGHDVLILSGGVSMGDADLVPELLRGLGLEVLIEKVAIKPGKPLLFGRVTSPSGHVCYVFGLPGNPVSSAVTFDLFVKPFVLAWAGAGFAEPSVVQARLLSPRAMKRIPRKQHLPCVLRTVDSAFVAELMPWHGSADLRGMLGADGLVMIDAGEGSIESGSLVEVHLLTLTRPLGEPQTRGRL
jgi:molybdopterin molybdotransferase